jgi:hypothetical protein
MEYIMRSQVKENAKGSQAKEYIMGSLVQLQHWVYFSS